MAPPPSGKVPVITLDLVARVLDRTVASPVGALALLAFSFWRGRNISGSALQLRDHLNAPDQTKLKLLVLFVLVKTVNRAFNRIARNGFSRADKPVFSLVKGKGDIILLTGGSTGIGMEMVEILSKVTSNIAVLDLAEPTYKASTSLSIPQCHFRGAYERCSIGNVNFYKCDVTDPAAIHAIALKIRAEVRAILQGSTTETDGLV